MTDSGSSPTIGDAIHQAAEALETGGVVFGHGTDNAWDEAVALVLSVTRLPDDRVSLNQPLTASVNARIQELLGRRIAERIPLAYLLGHAPFAGLDFLIEPGVVIPRSPIAELICQDFSPWLRQPPQRIIDLCCGSGCIGIAAALNFPDAHLTLVDVDAQAVRLTRKNVSLHALGDRATVLHSDLFEALAPGGFDLILSNPPYVDGTDMRALPPEYRHEPGLGLDGGPDGLSVVHRILAAVPERLNSGGILVCEVGASAPALLRAYPETEFFWPDLTGGGEGVFILSDH
ncbi:MAG: 50S ribosomal protein L3 N(5)-glutamine methyltransferase [Pseudomonadales bacterium]